MTDGQNNASEGLNERLWSLFQPETARQMKRVREHGIRFVHYTSAESGLAILRSQRVFLRNSTLMNDFSEVQHGLNCLFAAYAGPSGEKLKGLLNTIQADLPEILEANFNSSLQALRGETYLISISEHGDADEGDGFEDGLGRLSMWRAYAQKDGIAFVFNNQPFLIETNALNAYSSPVMYANPEDYAGHFAALVDGIEAELPLLQEYGGHWVHENLLHAFRFAAQSTKHPSFREEKEWRVIYSPNLLETQGLMDDAQKAKIPTEIKCLGGVPQRIYAIPFVNHPEEGFVGATIPELVDRILIGPSNDAYAIAQAFVAELEDSGVENASERVVVTGIPLRI